MLTAAIGAHIKEDDPITTNTPALTTLIRSLVVPNAAAIAGSAGNRQVLENVAASVIMLTMNKMTLFRQFGRA